MTKKIVANKEYSKKDLERIRKRASEIWKGKCQSLNTALDDWLQAERELLAATGATGKSSDQYTNVEIAKIKERAQAIREEKISSLRTAFDDWIEAEQEIKEELKEEINLRDLFDLWFDRSSSRIERLLEKNGTIQTNAFNDVLERQYVELMAECMR